MNAIPSNIRGSRVDSSTPSDHDGRAGATPSLPLFFRLGENADAARCVIKHHYSGVFPPPGTIICVGTAHEAGGLFGDVGRCVAAVVFCHPPARWSVRIVDLLRVVKVPDVSFPLSSLIAWTVRQLKKQGHHLAVSYADKSHNHHGGLYQACGWMYGGMRDPKVDGYTIDGEYVACRTLNHRYGTLSKTKLKEQHGIDATPNLDQGKHIYYLPLSKQGEAYAAQVNLTPHPYPKPRNEPQTGAAK